MLNEKEGSLKTQEEEIFQLEIRNKLLHDALQIQKEENEKQAEKSELQKYINKKLIFRNQELIANKIIQEKKLKRKNQKIKSLKSNIGYKANLIENLEEEKLLEREKKEFYLQKVIELEKELLLFYEKSQKMKSQTAHIEQKLHELKRTLS